MARQNQGLQIALIIFVMLTLVLGVTTFLAYRKYDEALEKDKVAKRDAEDQKTTAAAAKAEANEMKKMIGLHASKSFAEVEDNFKLDMDRLTSAMQKTKIEPPEEPRSYSKMLEFLWAKIDTSSKDFQAATVAMKTQTAQYEAREGSVDGKIKELGEEIAARGKKQEAALKEANEGRIKIVSDEQTLADQVKQARKEQTDRAKEAEKKIEDSQAQSGIVKELIRNKERKFRDLNDPHMTTPAGEVTWSDQRTGIVWINVGRADGLETRLAFNVYSSDATEMGKATKKATIEVTRIEGDHAAQARVLDDKVVDPIMPGDKIHTPLWKPGDHRRYALVGIMDIDNDGKNSAETVRNLIAMSNGLIDFEMDPLGKRIGEMTVNTRFLVLGAQPPGEGGGAYSRAINEATRLGIQRMTLAELKEKLGYKRPVGSERPQATEPAAKPAAAAVAPAAEPSEEAPPPRRAAAKPAGKPAARAAAGKAAAKPAGKAAGKAPAAAADDSPF